MIDRLNSFVSALAQRIDAIQFGLCASDSLAFRLIAFVWTEAPPVEDKSKRLFSLLPSAHGSSTNQASHLVQPGLEHNST